MKTPFYLVPENYKLGDAGCGCYLEPPGHPRYFIRPIYTRSENSPYSGPQYYLDGWGFEDLEEVDEWYGKMKNYPKLPLNHPRTRGWIQDLYKHFYHCYKDKEKLIDENHLVIFPIPSYKKEHFRDDPRFSEEWRQTEKARVDKVNKELEKLYAKVATVDNHMTVRLIRKHYPDYQPELNLIEKPSKRHLGSWWERLDEKPTPESCPGSQSLHRKHPVNGEWCQVCGWYKLLSDAHQSELKVKSLLS